MTLNKHNKLGEQAMFKDYYQILDIPVTATDDEIKKAYRSQSMKWHPDRNPGQDTTAKMQDINEAYNILKDPIWRAKYDAEYAKFNAAKYGRPESNDEANEYDIEDETLKEDIKEARKAAEDYVHEFFASLKNDSKKAAEGAWEGMKGYVIVGVIMSIIGIIAFAVSKNGPSTTPTYEVLGTPSGTYTVSLPAPTPRVLSPQTTPLDKWNDQTFFNAFSLSIPNTVEMQTKESPYIRQLAKNGIPSQIDDNVFIFNQKGLGNQNEKARKQYCRIMCYYDEGRIGDYLKRDETEFLNAEWNDVLSEIVSNNIGSRSRLMGTFSKEWVRINNANAIMISHQRTGDNFDTTIPVKCRILLFQDNNRFVQLILSYREKEANLWEDDFEQVLRSFKWKN